MIFFPMWSQVIVAEVVGVVVRETYFHMWSTTADQKWVSQAFLFSFSHEATRRYFLSCGVVAVLAWFFCASPASSKTILIDVLHCLYHSTRCLVSVYCNFLASVSISLSPAVFLYPLPLPQPPPRSSCKQALRRQWQTGRWIGNSFHHFFFVYYVLWLS